MYQADDFGRVQTPIMDSFVPGSLRLRPHDVTSVKTLRFNESVQKKDVTLKWDLTITNEQSIKEDIDETVSYQLTQT